MLPLLLLTACLGDPVLATETRGCTDYDFDDPAPPALKHEADGDAVVVWRTPVERPNLDDVFAPEFEIDGALVEVHERWTAGADGQAACLEPVLRVSEFGAPIEVRWFTEDDTNVPFDTITLKP